MWAAVSSETGGRVDTQVYALNNNIPGSDPQAFQMLLAGEIQFFTLMGGVIGTAVPVAYIQQLPYAFRSPAHAHAAFDGPLGAYLREEMAARGIQAFPVGAFDNGMRQITGNKRPVSVPADLDGMRMRVPSGEMIAETFRAFGAEPVVVNSIDIYEALKSGRVDAQENPLALVELFRLFEVVKFVSMTSHIWSGFNLMAHLPTWRRIPAAVQAVIESNVARHVRLQRQDQDAMNVVMRSGLARRGLVFNDVDPAPFRRHLSGFYREWRTRLGSRCWSLLESASGRLG
jgi:tripartite ATP-independent transporter DctP family solute receptor